MILFVLWVCLLFLFFIRVMFPTSSVDLAAPYWLENYSQCHLVWSLVEELLKCLDKLKLAMYMFSNIINDEPEQSSGPKLLMIPQSGKSLIEGLSKHILWWACVNVHMLIKMLLQS